MTDAQLESPQMNAPHDQDVMSLSDGLPLPFIPVTFRNSHKRRFCEKDPHQLSLSVMAKFQMVSPATCLFRIGLITISLGGF
jgi:hypothetical protein